MRILGLIRSTETKMIDYKKNILYLYVMKKIVLLVQLSIVLFSCDPNEKVNAPGLREAVENRKIKKIKEPDIQQRALFMGDSFAILAEKTLGSALKNAISVNGITNAISYCNVNAYPLLNDLQSNNNIEIRRASFKNRNPKNTPNDVEFKLLDAFHYNIENNISSTSSVQKVDSNYYYVKPIYIKEMCLNCHGVIGENITSENYESIKKLYPKDKAIGYKAGDFRGMWSIKIPKKQVVLAISDDTWKHKYEDKSQK